MKTFIKTSAVIILLFMVFFGCMKQSSPVAPVIDGTYTATPTITRTGTITTTPSISPTFSITMTTTITATITATSTQTPTFTVTPTFTATSTAVTISAYIDGFDTGGGMDITYDISIVDAGGNTITDAGVTVKNVSTAWQFTVPYNASTTSYNIEDPTGATIQYTPGSVYEIDVYSNGITYTAQSAAPGNGSLSSDCNTVSWQYDGNNDSIEVDNPSGAVALADSDPGLDYNTDISSAYSASGDYPIYLWLINSYDGVFAGSTSGSNIWVEYDTGWDVTN